MKEEFIKAVSDWYSFVSKDHHKDRDCHWNVSAVIRYSYDGTQTEKYWLVSHEGYITEFDESGNTEEEVMQKATDFIREFIKSHP